jgi:hypothetical protein
MYKFLNTTSRPLFEIYASLGQLRRPVSHDFPGSLQKSCLPSASEVVIHCAMLRQLDLVLLSLHWFTRRLLFREASNLSRWLWLMDLFNNNPEKMLPMPRYEPSSVLYNAGALPLCYGGKFPDLIQTLSFPSLPHSLFNWLSISGQLSLGWSQCHHECRIYHHLVKGHGTISLILSVDGVTKRFVWKID